MTGVVAAAIVGLSATPSQASGITAGVLPSQSQPDGSSYADWSARWWQWAYQTPAAINPLLAPNGAIDCSAGQAGHVWFLGGTFLSSAGKGVPDYRATRSCAIPAGTMLFIPIVNAEWDNLQVIGTAPTTLTFAQLQAEAKASMDPVTGMTATVDGKPVIGLGDASTSPYRVRSPLFTYSLPADNIDLAVGAPVPTGPIPGPGAAADGVFLMLAPLPVGTHTIAWSGGAPGGFTQEVKYAITVQPNRVSS